MNKFDERYEIRLAKYADIKMIMTFLNDHWREGHIMAIDQTLFEYEYVNGEDVNFVLAIDRNSGLLEGIFGFLNCSQTADLNKKDIWGSMWKVVEIRNNIPFLGIELAKRVVELTKCRTQIGNGANPKTTVPLRKMFFKEKVDKMQHFYLLNNNIEEYKIAIVNELPNLNHNTTRKSKIVRLNSIEDLKSKFDIEKLNTIPYKDNWYFNKRYFEHPYYTYEVYGVTDERNEVGAILVCREVIHNGSKVLRIMDYLGEESLFEGLYNEFVCLIEDRNIEYIDFYVYGFENQYITNAGFVLKNELDTNVIPNYFEPFLQSNVDIWIHYKLPSTKFFKADGDQDRPNLIRR
jgi:hypothetical protein